MRIIVTEKRLTTTDPETGRHYDLSEGDSVTVPDSFATELLSHGWVKDADGKVQAGERSINPVTVKPDKASIKPKAKRVR